MPKDCKTNFHMDSVYDPGSFAYMHRRRIECKPENIVLLFNCGKLKRPPPNCGILMLY